MREWRKVSRESRQFFVLIVLAVLSDQLGNGAFGFSL
jgi:hypothetical protein